MVLRYCVNLMWESPFTYIECPVCKNETYIKLFVYIVFQEKKGKLQPNAHVLVCGRSTKVSSCVNLNLFAHCPPTRDESSRLIVFCRWCGVSVRREQTYSFLYRVSGNSEATAYDCSYLQSLRNNILWLLFVVVDVTLRAKL